MAYWTTLPPQGFVEPGAKRAACLERDDAYNAAAVLDPACFPTLMDYGNNQEDATNFFYMKIIKPRAKVVDPQGKVVEKDEASVAASKATLTRLKNQIRGRAKPSPFMSDATWNEEIEHLCRLEDDKFKAAGGGAAEAEQALDPLGPLLTKLSEEMKTLTKKTQ